jgi:hypothetical protein
MVLLAFLAVVGCSKKADIDPSVFRNMPAAERVAYFNSLGKSQRIAAFVRCASVSKFLAPPNDYILFRGDGKLFHTDTIGEGKVYGVIGSWKAESGKLTILSVRENEGLSNILGSAAFEIRDISAEPMDTNPPSVSYDLGPGKIVLISE